jgi:hypothetical protein
MNTVTPPDLRNRRPPPIFADELLVAESRGEYASFSVAAYPTPEVRLRGSGLDRTAARGEESVGHYPSVDLNSEQTKAMAGSIDWHYTRKG